MSLKVRPNEEGTETMASSILGSGTLMSQSPAQ